MPRKADELLNWELLHDCNEGQCPGVRQDSTSEALGHWVLAPTWNGAAALERAISQLLKGSSQGLHMWQPHTKPQSGNNINSADSGQEHGRAM